MITHIHLAPLVLPWLALNRPFVAMVHGLEIWPLSRLRRYLLRRADVVLTNSWLTRSRVASLHAIPDNRIGILPLCPDYYWKMTEIALSPSPSESVASPTLLTVGRAMKSEGYKGQDSVIRALPRIAEICPQVRYIVVGGGDDQERLRRLAESVGVAGQVYFAGYQPEEALRRFFQDCSVFVMPSRGEGFGLVYLEAMNYKKPCIASNCDAGQEIVHDGVNGYTVDPDDTGALARAAIRLLCDAGLRTAFGEAGFKMLQSEYTFARFSDTLHSTLDGALHARREAQQRA